MTGNPRPGPVRVIEGYGLGDAPADGTVLPWSTVEGWLTGARNYWVGSSRADGRPHVMPVWGLWIDGAVWFSTDPDSVKARNLVRAPEVVVHLESGDEVCVIEGRARRVAPADAHPEFVPQYAAKYDIELDLSEPNFALYVVEPVVVLTWRESDYPVSATRWTFD